MFRVRDADTHSTMACREHDTATRVGVGTRHAGATQDAREAAPRARTSESRASREHAGHAQAKTVLRAHAAAPGAQLATPGACRTERRSLVRTTANSRVPGLTTHHTASRAGCVGRWCATGRASRHGSGARWRCTARRSGGHAHTGYRLTGQQPWEELGRVGARSHGGKLASRMERHLRGRAHRWFLPIMLDRCNTRAPGKTRQAAPCFEDWIGLMNSMSTSNDEERERNAPGGPAPMALFRYRR
jgi:hypothetical protein